MMNVLTCSFLSPHTNKAELKLGELSVLFSYGQPVGFSRHGVTFVTGAPMNNHTRRHLNNWRDFRQHKIYTADEFVDILIRAVNLESKTILITEMQGMTNKKEEAPMPGADQLDIDDEELNSLTDEAEDDEDDNSGSDDDEDLEGYEDDENQEDDLDDDDDKKDPA